MARHAKVSEDRAIECKYAKEDEPKLRHEFVGMMFAVTIGEVGLQVASLVKYEGSFHYFLPAYTHLTLATIVIAASWVGWTLSPSPGARHDVTAVFKAEFLVLLIDVALVICYFVLARSVDFQKSETGGGAEFKASAAPEALWILIIFGIYLFWDFWTKIVVFVFRRATGVKDDGRWGHYLVRFIPTLGCCALAWWAFREFVDGLTASQVVIADLALLALVLFFRAAKDVTSAFWRSKGHATKSKRIFSSVMAAFLFGTFIVCLYWTKHGPTGALDDFINKVKPPKDVTLSMAECGATLAIQS
jgi:hypothetical protein